MGVSIGPIVRLRSGHATRVRPGQEFFCRVSTFGGRSLWKFSPTRSCWITGRVVGMGLCAPD